MQQGAASHCLHILVEGHVRVDRDRGQTVQAGLGPGDVVGEMGVLTGAPRSATVTAIDEVETLELSADELTDIFREDHLVVLLKELERQVRLLLERDDALAVGGPEGRHAAADLLQRDAGMPHAYYEILRYGRAGAFDVMADFFHDVPADIVAEAFRRGERKQSGTPFSQPWP